MHATALENASASGFQSAAECPGPIELAVFGVVPSWLRGRMIHTGPALFELPRGRYTHWFDGLAQLRGIELADGRASYRSRFLGSEAYRRAREAGRPVLGEFGTRPPRGRVAELLAHLWPPHATDNANVNVVDLGGRLIAMTESSRHVEIDPTTLETRGELVYDDDLEGQVSTAHPHVDRAAGVLHNLLIRFGRTSAIQVYALRLGTTRRELVATLETSRPSYVHSFATTEHFVVVTENPLVANPLKLRFSTRPYFDRYDWRPELGSRIQVVRKDDGRVVASARTEPRFVFHHANAFEVDGSIEVDAVAFPDPLMVRDLTLDALRRGQSVATGRLTRLSIRAAGFDQHVAPVDLIEEPIELPRIDPRRERRPYRYLYAVGNAEPGDFFDRVLKADLDARTTRSFHRDGWYFDEPLFVPSPLDAAEDDGVVLCTVLDAQARCGRLAVLDARSLTLIGAAELPQIVPFYFHGQWFPAA